MVLFAIFSARSLSVSQLKPEILVCRMAALMINVTEERQKQTRNREELFRLPMLIEAIYILYILSPNKSVKEERGWGITVLCGHLCNDKSHS